MGLEATFLNASIQGQGTLCLIGNFALTPYRYLFGGRDIKIIQNGGRQTIHHIASFHPFGSRNKCQTNPAFHSSETNMLRTAAAIALLVPGLMIGFIFKWMGYVFSKDAASIHGEVYSEVSSKPLREELKRSLQKFSQIMKDAWSGKSIDDTEIDDSEMNVQQIRAHTDLGWKMRILNIQEVGSFETPIKSELELTTQIRKIDRNQPVDTLIIYGNNKLQINNDPGIMALNPMKIILIGASLGSTGIGAKRLGNGKSDPSLPQLRESLTQSGKWRIEKGNSLEKALEATNEIRNYLLRKRWHVLYELQPDTPNPKPKKAAPKSKIHTLHRS